MYRFYITVHARPAAASPGPVIELAGRPTPTLAVPPDTLGRTPMDCTFETACGRLSDLGQMFCEPDGAFVWVSRQGEPAWQVDGNLYDREERLTFVDLKGTCPADQFDRLLGAFGWPATPLVFQLTREAVLLDEPEFRRHAQRAAGP